MMQSSAARSRQEGFSLIEMMVTMLIALVVLGAMVMNFTRQHSEYKYQMKRVDAVQDLEFSMKFIAEDLRGALWSDPTVAAVTVDPNPEETNGFAGTAASTDFTFWVWDKASGGNADTVLTKRQYQWDSANKLLKYDRLIATKDLTGTDTASSVSLQDILPNVTFFKVFLDGTASATSRAGFSNIPAALPLKTLPDAEGNPVTVSGYTILIEVAVDAGYQEGSFLDVTGTDVRTTTDKRKRVWRYVQVYPMSLMAMGMMLVGV